MGRYFFNTFSFINVSRETLEGENMNVYIETNKVNAMELTRGGYNLYRGWTIPEDENPEDEGYLIMDTVREHVCWKPKKVFEETHKPFEKFSKLTDTVPYMCSESYRDRFLAEYFQLKIRYDALRYMVEKWDKGELNFTPTCERSLYGIQLTFMYDYLTILEGRAKEEGILLHECV